MSQSEENFRQFFENSPEYFYMISPDGKIVDVNKAALDTLGYKKSELIGRPVKTVYHPESYKKMGQLFTKWLKTGKVENEEIAIITKNGNKRTVILSIDSIKDSNGNIKYSISVQKDITERKKAEETLLEYQDRLRLLNSELSLAEERERKQIVELLHDDVCQILGLIMIRLQQIRSSDLRPEILESVSELCGMLKQTIQTVRTLMSDIRPHLLYDLGLEAAVDKLLADLVKWQEDIELVFENDGKSKPLDNSIRILLYQSVRELLMNIVKHARASKVKVSIQKEGNKISIVVEDDGIGFDVPEKMDRADTRKGFGLFSIRKRMRNLGGNFEIESEADRGTRVTLLAPLGE